MLNFGYYLIWIIVLLIINYLINSNKKEEVENFEVDNMMDEELMNYSENLKNNEVKPSNLQPIMENTSNFISNVMDIDNFYKINQPNEQPIKQPTTYFDFEDKNNMWNYKNESMLNGRELYNNVRGYDDSDDYASFNNDFKILSKSCNTTEICDDDLRMGLGKPNFNNRMTN